MRIAFALVMAIIAGVAMAAEKVTIDKGGSRTVDPGFQVVKYDAGRGDVVSVEVLGGTPVLTGVAEGTCTVKLMGADSSLEEVYEVVVGNDLMRIMRKLQKRIENGVTGIEISKQDGYILIRGEINDPDEWFLLKKIVAEDDYTKFVRDDTIFRIQADILKKFYTEIEDAGFVLTDNIADTEKGALKIKYDNNVVTISGTIFAPERLDRLQQIVNSKSWLRNADAPLSDVADSWKPTCRLNITLDRRLLHMDVVLIGYSENEGFKYGRTNNELPIISTVFNGFIDLVHGKSKNDSFRVNADLNDTIDFLKKSGITRESIGGYLRFRSNDTFENRLHIGGTLKVKLRGATAEGAPTENFSDINYGFTVEKKEASLIDAETVHIQLLIKQENPIPIKGAGYEEGYDVQQYEYNPVIDCPLGQTVVIAGYHKMIENTIPPSGFPVLRRIPIVKWFIAKESNSIEDIKLMMLVSVRAVNPKEPEPQQATLPYEDSRNLPTEIEVPNDERLKAREKEKKSKGFWSWLFSS